MASINNLPEDISAIDSCQKFNDTAAGFNGLHSPFSKYNNTEFTVINEKFCNDVQCIQTIKVASLIVTLLEL